MKITVIDECPKGLRHFDRHEEDDDLESKLTPRDIEDIVAVSYTQNRAQDTTQARVSRRLV